MGKCTNNGCILAISEIPGKMIENISAGDCPAKLSKKVNISTTTLAKPSFVLAEPCIWKIKKSFISIILKLLTHYKIKKFDVL